MPAAGVDAAWLGTDPALLLARGLQRSQEKVTTRQDPRLAATKKGAFKPRGVGANKALPAALPPLWRWAPEFRAKAVMAELSSRVLVTPAVEAAEDRSARVGLYRLEYQPAAEQFLFERSLGFVLDADFDWNSQCDKVLRAAIEREDRLPEILTQREDVWTYFHAAVGLLPGTAPRLAEAMQAAWGWGEGVVMALKHHLAVLRPFQRNSLIVPLIETPAHGSLPSGHATMTAMTAQLFIDLLELKADSPRALTLNRLARRIAFNRVAAGVHFPVDSLAGYKLGKHLAGLLRAWGEGRPLPQTDVFTALRDSGLPETHDTADEPEFGDNRPEPLPIWSALWDAAREETAGWSTQ